MSSLDSKAEKVPFLCSPFISLTLGMSFAYFGGEGKSSLRLLSDSLQLFAFSLFWALIGKLFRDISVNLTEHEETDNSECVLFLSMLVLKCGVEMYVGVVYY